MTMQTLSNYEIRRLENIKKNEAVLRSLGLDPNKNTAVIGKPKKRTLTHKQKKQTENTAPLPKRRSRRVRGIAVDGTKIPVKRITKTPRKISELRVPLWTQQLFSDIEQNKNERALQSCIWGRHHQHLDISPMGTVVATTRQAGYGACLAVYNKAKPQCYWEVKVIKNGVGGFAGIAKDSMKAPFKSLGRTPNAIVWHSRGVLMNNRKETSFGVDEKNSVNEDVYTEGDTIGVKIVANENKTNQKNQKNQKNHKNVCNDNIKVIFFKNDIKVGSTSVSGSCNWTLAVQPYLGGVAEIVQSSTKKRTETIL